MNRIRSKAVVAPANIIPSVEGREPAHSKRPGIRSLLIRCARSVRLKVDSNEWSKADSSLVTTVTARVLNQVPGVLRLRFASPDAGAPQSPPNFSQIVELTLD